MPDPGLSTLSAKSPSTLQYVKPTDEQLVVMQAFRDKYEALLVGVRALPMNRGLALAVTALEESAMWLNKSITNNC